MFRFGDSSYSRYVDHFFLKFKPYGQLGQEPIGNFCCLIEIHFISLFSAKSTCETVNKSSKSVICYIDSETCNVVCLCVMLSAAQ